MALYFSCSATSSSSSLSTSFCCSLVSRHLCEGHLELLCDGLVLLLLSHQLVLQSVHLLLKLLDGLLGKLSPGLSLLQLGAQCLDLLLVGLLPLVGLLLCNLKRFQVVGHHPELLLKLEDLGLSSVCSLISLLELRLTGSQLLGNFVIGSVGGCGLVKLLVGGEELLLGGLEVLFQLLDSPVEGVHLSLGSEQGLLLLLQLHAHNGELLVGHVQLSLQLPSLGHQLGHLLLGLVSPHLGHLAGLLAGVTPVTGIVFLHLHGLHLLLDGVHFESLIAVAAAADFSLTSWRLGVQ